MATADESLLGGSKPKTPEISNRGGAQSANQVLFFNKKQQALYQQHFANGNESIMFIEDSQADLKKTSPISSNNYEVNGKKSNKNNAKMCVIDASIGDQDSKNIRKSKSNKRKKSHKRQ